MKKIRRYLIWGAVLSVFFGGGCAQSAGQETSADPVLDPSFASVSEVSARPVSAPSSKTNLLPVGEWGRCAKYVPSEQQYASLPVRLTGFVRGEKAEALVKEWREDAYEKPEEGFVWVAAEYEVCLTGFPMDKMGADAVLPAHLEDEEDPFPQCSGQHFSGRVLTLTGEGTAFEGMLSGKLAYLLPKKAETVCLVLGETGEEQAFFSGVPEK